MISETDGTIIGVYVSIGNTDNKLTCQEWAEFWEAVDLLLTRSGRNTAVYGRWHSIPTTPYVNACWAVEVPTVDRNWEYVTGGGPGGLTPKGLYVAVREWKEADRG